MITCTQAREAPREISLTATYEHLPINKTRDLAGAPLGVTDGMEPSEHAHLDAHRGDSAHRAALLHALPVGGSGGGTAVRGGWSHRFARWLLRAPLRPDLAPRRLSRPRSRQADRGRRAGAAREQGSACAHRPD